MFPNSYTLKYLKKAFKTIVFQQRKLKIEKVNVAVSKKRQLCISMNICKTRLNMITHAVNYTFKSTVMCREENIRMRWGEGGPNRWPGMQMSSSGRSYNVARLANALMTLLHIYGYGCSLTAEPERSVVTDCDVDMQSVDRTDRQRHRRVQLQPVACQ